MKTVYLYFFCLLLLEISCKKSSLHTVCKLQKSIKESSAIETIPNSNLLWTIEDSNNKNIVYGIKFIKYHAHLFILG